MNEPACPADSLLLGIATDDANDSQLESHVRHCKWCQDRIKQMQLQLNQMADACNEMASHQTDLQIPEENPDRDHDPPPADDD